MPIDNNPGGTDILDISGNGHGADINSTSETVEITDQGLDIVAGKALTIGDIQVVGPRISGMPVAASDLTTAIALLNFIRSLLITHGLGQT